MYVFVFVGVGAFIKNVSWCATTLTTCCLGTLKRKRVESVQRDKQNDLKNKSFEVHTCKGISYGKIVSEKESGKDMLHDLHIDRETDKGSWKIKLGLDL